MKDIVHFFLVVYIFSFFQCNQEQLRQAEIATEPEIGTIEVGWEKWDATSKKKGSNDFGYTWDEAYAYCKNRGKRLPNLKEMEMKWDKLNDNGWHWTSTEVEHSPAQAYIILLNDGEVRSIEKSYHKYVRCKNYDN